MVKKESKTKKSPEPVKAVSAKKSSPRGRQFKVMTDRVSGWKKVKK